VRALSLHEINDREPVPMQAVGEPGALTPLTVTVTSIDDPGGATLSIQKIHGSILIAGAGRARAGRP